MQSYALSEPEHQSLYLSIDGHFGYRYLRLQLTPEQYKEVYKFNTNPLYT
jgi:hypothetical protein